VKELPPLLQPWQKIPFRVIPWSTPPLTNTCTIDTVLMALYLSIGGLKEGLRQLDSCLGALFDAFDSMARGEFLAAKLKWGAQCNLCEANPDWYTDEEPLLFKPLCSSKAFQFEQVFHWTCFEHCSEPSVSDGPRWLVSGPDDVSRSLTALVWRDFASSACGQCKAAPQLRAAHVVTSNELTVLMVQTASRTADVSGVASRVTWLSRTFSLAAYLWNIEDHHTFAWIRFDPFRFTEVPDSLQSPGWYRYDGVKKTAQRRFAPVDVAKAPAERGLHLVALLYVADFVPN